MRDRLRIWLKQLFSTEGFRGPVLTLLTGSTAVLTLSYLSQPVITRLYTPDEFGVAGYFVAVMTVLISFTSLRYEDALMLPEDDDEAAVVAWLALVVLACFTVVISILVIWREALAALVGIPAVAPFLVLVPPALLAMRITKVAELWLIRAKRFRHVTAGHIANTTTMVTVRIGAGLPPINAGAGGLIGGFLAGHILSMLVVGGTVLRQSARRLFAAFGWARIANAARRYRRFPLFSTPSALIGALIVRLPFFLLPLYFEDAVVGLFLLAFNVVSIPLSHVGSAIARVFFVHAAEAQREARLTEVSDTVHKRLVMLGLFPTLALLLAGPDVFEVFFGTDWREAGVYVQYVGPWLFLGAVASPLTRLFDVLERQRMDFATSLLMFVLMAAALVVGGRTGEVTTTLLLLGSVGAGVRLIQLGVLLRLAHVPYPKAFGAYGRYLLFSLPGLLLIAVALWLNSVWLTTGAAIVAGLIYVGLVLWKDKLLALRPDDSNPKEE